MSRRRNIYVRQWRIVRALHGRRYGLGVEALQREVGTSRSTLYRDLTVLRDAGIPIASENRNGEARYFLLDQTCPPLQPTSLEVHALCLARTVLAPLDGSSLAARIDDLLARSPRNADPPRITARRRALTDPAIVATLERAIHASRRARIHYRGTRDRAARWRCVDPLGIRLVAGHLYLIAHDEQAAATRTFKVARIAKAELLRERAAAHPPIDHDALFAHSVKVWTGPLFDVAIHLSEDVAPLAREWPLLPTQTLTPTDGGIIVRARVAGLEETVRWVLAWGQAARPLEPSDLVAAVRRELEGALAGLRRGRPADRETRVVHKA